VVGIRAQPIFDEMTTFASTSNSPDRTVVACWAVLGGEMKGARGPRVWNLRPFRFFHLLCFLSVIFQHAAMLKSIFYR
jgi:hypothetical protein